MRFLLKKEKRFSCVLMYTKQSIYFVSREKGYRMASFQELLASHQKQSGEKESRNENRGAF